MENLRYFDKNGKELHEGDTVIFDCGMEYKLYRTVDGELGTDATNPKWIEIGRACECEYGIYPLSASDLKQITLKE